MKTLGIDIGGSGIKGAPVDLKTGRLTAKRVRIETPEPARPVAVARAVAELVKAFDWRGPVGVGYPGVICDGRTMTAANLHPDWIGLDAGRLFSRASRCPVTVINDADAAGLAEMRFGAGRKESGTVLLVTLGTGVGSALFRGGRLFPNTELGHLPWRGGKSAEKFVSAAARKRRGLSWEEWAGRLNDYLHTLESLLWPDLIIVGGGVSAKYRKWIRFLRLRTKIVPAKLFNEAGIVGAALAAARKH